MQNQKKVKKFIVCSILSIITLLIVSIVLIVNINKTNTELANQKQQIAEIEKQIENLNNSPSNNDQQITKGEN